MLIFISIIVLLILGFVCLLLISYLKDINNVKPEIYINENVKIDCIENIYGTFGKTGSNGQYGTFGKTG